MILFILFIIYFAIGYLYSIAMEPFPTKIYDRLIITLFWPLDLVFYMYILALKIYRKIWR